MSASPSAIDQPATGVFFAIAAGHFLAILGVAVLLNFGGR